MGVCLNVTVRYAPSYSTALRCDGCDGAATLGDYRWKATEAAAQWCAWRLEGAQPRADVMLMGGTASEGRCATGVLLSRADLERCCRRPSTVPQGAAVRVATRPDVD